MLLVASLALPGCTSPRVALLDPPAKDEIRPILAVTSFDNRSGFPGQWALGEGIADLLVADLVASKHFVVVERRELNQVIGEINSQGSKYFRPEGKATAGRLKNVQYFIRGVITDFGHVAEASLKTQTKKGVFGASGYTARVALTMTIVELESGQIVSSVSSDGYAEAGGGFAEGEYKGVRFGGDAFFRTPLGIATQDAIRRGLREIVKTVPKSHWVSRVAAVEGTKIFITGGSEQGQFVGQELDVLGPDKPIVDPATGDVIDLVPGGVIGRVRVSEAREKTSIAVKSAGGEFEVGTRLRPVTVKREEK